MAHRTSGNPFAFTPLPVTIITSLVYVALIATLLVTRHVVPSAPEDPTPVEGINITEAWRDLQELTNGFHPYNSRRNDQVRDWLLGRIDRILESNKIKHSTLSTLHARNSWNKTSHAPVVVFNDMTSNLMFSSTAGNQSVYFEGTNIIVYIRGTEDGDEDWWEVQRSPKAARAYTGKGGVLVNAHYDSVSTGLGATDDGVGVVTVLQLIKYFTTRGQRPKRGVVALLNNGEEDFLNGARAFSQHPMSQFPHTFLNLEGAGAGGRATLFRSTDAEVTQYYKKARYPFGTVISADGFKRGLIRSQTDYVVFNGELGLRGLDVAFMEPRARYHTIEDSARQTSRDSLWHMLSGALATMKGLSSDTSSTFDGKADESGKTTSGHGSDGVWFDVFGQAFVLIRLHTLFALSIMLLVVTPVVLLLLHIILVRLDKWYLFSRRKYVHSSEDDDHVPLDGWRGFFRFPIAFIASTGAVIALAFLLVKANPYIIYSSEYAIWSMMLSAWLAMMCFFLQGANFIRESALQRAYVLLWLYVAGWLATVAVTVGEDRFHIGGGYFLIIYFAANSAALLISYVEFFALPRKATYAQELGYDAGQGNHTAVSRRSRSLSSRRLRGHSRDERAITGDVDHCDDGGDVDETTSLLRDDQQASFARYGRPRRSPIGGRDETEDDRDPPPPYNAAYGNEQPWSGSMPRWTWLIQFILFAPIVVILVGQIGLLLTSALAQTPADGSSVLFIYLCIAALSVLLLNPLTPFLHRFTYHIPTFLLLVFSGTLMYNLLAFPFSPNARLKVYFQQQIDLDAGINRVSLTGLDPYVRHIISEIPSAAGQQIECSAPDYAVLSGLTECIWHGLTPHVVPSSNTSKFHMSAKKEDYKSWLSYNVTRPNANLDEATFTVVGRNTRACKLVFTNTRISDFNVTGAMTDPRYKRVGEDGSKEIRLWSREWEKPWHVSVRWGGGGGEGPGGGSGVGKGDKEVLRGDVVCLWSDDNESGVIPALDEVRRFMPSWSTVSKLGDGLVEGKKGFSI